VLPAGVELTSLTPHRDARGTFIELFRESWSLPVSPVQWNVVHSEANVLRGVHAHWRHSDYFTVVVGRASVGLFDLREGSPTGGHGTVVEVRADDPAALLIPIGVAHGFHFPEPSVHVYAVSHDWDPADELGCRWDDPELALEWPNVSPVLSERDAELGSLGELRAAVRERLVPVVS
jgi:dTDP-4-dehydrorhamnose 3,5-epimerase